TAGNNGISLQNRFAPLQNKNQENDPSSENNKRFENNLHSKQSSPKLPEKKRPTRPRTLIVGNTAVDGIKNFCNKKNTEVMTGTSNMVSDISENILAITEKRPSLENLIIHCGDIFLRKIRRTKGGFHSSSEYCWRSQYQGVSQRTLCANFLWR
ncbi:hypothetical protein ILYODFUR_025969, partial [Ilyodon furcidens]